MEEGRRESGRRSGGIGRKELTRRERGEKRLTGKERQNEIRNVVRSWQK